MNYKNYWDVPITQALLHKDQKSLSSMERQAVEHWKKTQAIHDGCLAEYNEEIKENCKMLCSGHESMPIPSYGWIDPIRKLCYKLEDMNYDAIKRGIYVQLAQSKEKFGTLRFYVDFVDVPTGFAAFISWPFRKLSNCLSKLDFKRTYKTIQEPMVTLEWEECSKKDFNKKLDRQGKTIKNAKLKDPNDIVQHETYLEDTKHDENVVYFKKTEDKYYRSYWLHHGAKTQMVVTKHKILFNVMMKADWMDRHICQLLTRNSKRKMVFKESFVNEVGDLIRIAEDRCYDLCEECGAIIGTEHKARCEKHGWIRYLCENCSIATGSIYYNQNKKKYFVEGKEVQSPYNKKAKKNENTNSK